MKQLLFILFLGFSLNVFSGDTTNIPEKNRKVLELAKAKLGQKVGDGICRELVEYCAKEVNPRWRYKYKKIGRMLSIPVYGKEIKREDVKPGDIVLFYNVMINKHFVFGHVAVVVELTKDKLVVLEQNTKGSLEKSIVVQTEREFKNILGKHLYFFRIK